MIAPCDCHPGFWQEGFAFATEIITRQIPAGRVYIMLAEDMPFHLCFFICPMFETVLPDSDGKGALLCLWIALQSRNTKHLRTCLVNMLVLEHGCMAMTQAFCDCCYPRQDAVTHMSQPHQAVDHITLYKGQTLQWPLVRVHSSLMRSNL